jgi:hypothetical protein
MTETNFNFLLSHVIILFSCQPCHRQGDKVNKLHYINSENFMAPNILLIELITGMS